MNACACMYAECAQAGTCLAQHPELRAMAMLGREPLPVFYDQGDHGARAIGPGPDRGAVHRRLVPAAPTPACTPEAAVDFDFGSSEPV